MTIYLCVVAGPVYFFLKFFVVLYKGSAWIPAYSVSIYLISGSRYNRVWIVAQLLLGNYFSPLYRPRPGILRGTRYYFCFLF